MVLLSFQECLLTQACSVDYGHTVCHVPVYVKVQTPAHLIAVTTDTTKH